MDELKALRSLARAMGVHTRYTDGLGRRVIVAPETLVRVCAALGAPVERPADAAAALGSFRESCPKLTARSDASGLTRPADWAPACAAASYRATRRAPRDDDAGPAY